jgi:hypothetical protein
MWLVQPEDASEKCGKEVQYRRTDALYLQESLIVTTSE